MPKQARHGSPISNREWTKWAGNAGSIMLGAEQSSSLHPILVSEAEPRSSFQQEPPAGWGISFQVFKCAAWHTRLFSVGRVWEPVSHSGFNVRCFFVVFFKGETTKIQSNWEPQGVKWGQTWNILPRELCWLLMRCVTYWSQIIYYNRPHEDTLRMYPNVVQFGNSKSKQGKEFLHFSPRSLSLFTIKK